MCWLAMKTISVFLIRVNLSFRCSFLEAQVSTGRGGMRSSTLHSRSSNTSRNKTKANRINLVKLITIITLHDAIRDRQDKV